MVRFLTNTLGNILVVLRPKKARQLSEDGLTLVIGDNLSASERLMRRAILKKIEKTKDYDKLAQLHKTYWVKQGDDFVNNTQNNLENIHLPAYKTVLDILKNEILCAPIKFEKLIEIGTGNGSVLNFLSSNYLEIDNLIGIDLSEEQTIANKVNYKNNPKLEFIDGDVLDWVENQRQGHMVFLTFRGVLEYFSQQQLICFFEKLNSLGKIIFFAIEPIDSNNDFKTDSNSKVYGFEGAFSHDYKKIFEDAGFKIWHAEQKEELGSPNIMSITGAKNF
ncbi:MAG: hypothetical protein ACJA2M_000463 [Polaribacter sp.]|jgi:hypothetical protein